MPADEHLGDQFKVYHGTSGSWSGKPSASHERPFHVATDTDLPSDHAWPVTGYDAEMDHEILTEGHIKEFAVDPAAKIHHTEEGHFDGVLSPEGQEEAKGYDMTVFKGQGLGIVYNPDVLHHVRNIGYREHMHSDPEEQMEEMHGEDWRHHMRRR
jgi:hypothetical protein